MIQLCPCGSTLSYQNCCNRIHQNQQLAETAEQLMRSRYTAFTFGLVDFLYDSFHPQTRRFQKKSEIESWAKENNWQELEIIKSTASTVEFKAYYIDLNGELHVHHEKSNFKQLNGIWYYYDGKLKA